MFFSHTLAKNQMFYEEMVISFHERLAILVKKLTCGTYRVLPWGRGPLEVRHHLLNLQGAFLSRPQTLNRQIQNQEQLL